MSVHKEFDTAAAEHRMAAAYLELARSRLHRQRQAPRLSDRQRRLATQLAQAATTAAPGWLGCDFDDTEKPLAAASAEEPLAVRIGQCQPDSDLMFGVIINLLGTGHLAINSDPSDARALAILRTVPLRLLAARPSESLHVSFADLSGADVFGPFKPLFDSGMADPPVTDETDFAALLNTAEAHVEQAKRRRQRQSTVGTADLPERLVVLAGLPAESEDSAATIASLAHEGPDARLHLVLCDSRLRPKKSATSTTHVAIDAAGVEVAGVPHPVRIDPPPAKAAITRICQRLADSRTWVIEDGLL